MSTLQRKSNVCMYNMNKMYQDEADNMPNKTQFHTLIEQDDKTWIKTHGLKYEHIVKMGILHAQEAPQLKSIIKELENQIQNQAENIKKMNEKMMNQAKKIYELEKETIKEA